MRRGNVRSDPLNKNNVQYASASNQPRPASLYGEQGTQGIPVDDHNRRWSNNPPPIENQPRKLVRRQSAGPPDRPAFKRLKTLDDFLIKSSSVEVNPNQTLQAQGLSRNHRMSYADIRDNVAKLCTAENSDRLKKLFYEVIPDFRTGRRFRAANNALEKLTSAISKNEPIESLRDQFISELNSCPANLSLGNSRINSVIGRKFDPNFIENPNSSHSFSPNTRQIISGARQHGIDLTAPKIKDFQIHSSHGKGREIPIGSLTPTSDYYRRLMGWYQTPPELMLPESIITTKPHFDNTGSWSP